MRLWHKPGFYAAQPVDEQVIVDPQDRRVHQLALGQYHDPSEVIEVGSAGSGRTTARP